ncbi:MAG: cobalamin B12-binding domain-containing protein [Pseudomonadota bacterium]
MSFKTHPSELLDIGGYTKRQLNLLRRAKTLPEDKLESLAREALKRLAAKYAKCDAPDLGPSQEDLTSFCNALASDDQTAAADFISELNAKNVRPEAVYLQYLAAAARLLGQWWDEDRIGLWQVTIGTGRLLAIMRSMAHLFEPAPRPQHKTAVFASMPGEQHVLGVFMAADIFRKEGWNISVKAGLDHDQLVAEMEHAPSDLFGLSLGGTHALDALSKLVIALRLVRPYTPIFLSGHGVNALRSKLAWMELDGVAEDIDEAKTKMTDIWERKHMPA